VREDGEPSFSSRGSTDWKPVGLLADRRSRVLGAGATSLKVRRGSGCPTTHISDGRPPSRWVRASDPRDVVAVALEPTTSFTVSSGPVPTPRRKARWDREGRVALVSGGDSWNREGPPSSINKGNHR
jgi:hypothetical protein